MIAHVIDCYANEMKSGGGQGDHDPDDQPMQIGECNTIKTTVLES